MAGYSDQFATDLDRLLGVPDTAQNHRFYAAWAQAEGGSAAYNPFNTTQGAPGATNLNGVGVKNYTSYQQGLQATYQTLKNGLYQPILNALGQGNDAMATAKAEASTPWGTGDLIQKVLGGGGGSSAGASPGGGTGGGTASGPGIYTVAWNPLSNPLDWPGDAARGLAGAAGSAAGAAGSAAASGIASLLSAALAPFEKYLEDAALILFGFVLVVVGLIMLSKASGGGGGAAAAGGGRGGRKEGEGGEAAGGGVPVEAVAAA